MLDICTVYYISINRNGMKLFDWLFGKKKKKVEPPPPTTAPAVVEEPVPEVPPIIEPPKRIEKKKTIPVKSKILTTMTSQEKKDLIRKKLDAGDKRSWYEIAADLELQLWSEKHG